MKVLKKMRALKALKALHLQRKLQEAGLPSCNKNIKMAKKYQNINKFFPIVILSLILLLL